MMTRPPTVQIPAALDADLRRYLETGDHDPLGLAWPKGNVLERITSYAAYLREGLVAEVQRRERGRPPACLPLDLDPASFARARLEPMVRGLFPASERDAVLALLQRSVRFLTTKTIHEFLLTEDPGTAWQVADLYLVSLGCEGLADDGKHPVGMSVGDVSYVSVRYFDDDDPFADYVVHEAAHAFHHVKRDAVGLRRTRSREWLLDVAFKKRETFAYACEAYSRIVARSSAPRQRSVLLAEYAEGPLPADDGVDPAELLDILKEAVSARNGWKRILRWCSPSKRQWAEHDLGT